MNIHGHCHTMQVLVMEKKALRCECYSDNAIKIINCQMQAVNSAYSFNTLQAC